MSYHPHSPQPQPPRPSRYKSVRRTQAQQSALIASSTPPPPLPPAFPNPPPEPSLGDGRGPAQWSSERIPRLQTAPSNNFTAGASPRTERPQMLSAGQTTTPMPGGGSRPRQYGEQDSPPPATLEGREDTMRRTSGDVENVQGRVGVGATPEVVLEAEAVPEQIAVVQRSRSRYHRGARPATVDGPAVPPVPVGLQRTIGASKVAPGDARGMEWNGGQDRQQVQVVFHERAVRRLKTDDLGTGVKSNPPNGASDTQHQFVPLASLQPQLQPQLQTRVRSPPDTRETTRSRYHTTNIQGSLEPSRESKQPHYNTAMPQRTQHPHHDAERRLQRQATFPSTARPTARFLTKESLEQIPDDTVTKSAALHRHKTLINQQATERRRAERKEIGLANSAARQLLDAEAERQRRVKAKIRAEKDKAEKAKAEEEAELRRRLQEEEERRQSEEDHKRAQAAAQAEKKRLEQEARALKKAQSSSATPWTGRQLNRKTSAALRAQRERKRSLSKLEGNSQAKVGVVEDTHGIATPPPTPESTEEKAAFRWLKTRRPAEASSHEDGGLRAKSQPRGNEKPEPLIKQGGGGAAPAFDAPASAINYGERRVLVECNKSSIILPINPTSTPMDLIHTAANVLNEPINAKASVLLESFGKVGVQRPLRKYEHVRDVMNSWDDDQQNSLVLMPSATGGNDIDLEAHSVPKDQPGEFSCQLHYSQKPGKWDKRWITLRTDGQMVLSKSEGHKDVSNLCHMTDFDIYSPELHTLAKRVKPPKKICFAVKSQQKSSMFQSLEDFVHFFCTSDKESAAAWYKAVQGWRSWYLVHVLGEGKTDKAEKDEKGRNGAPLISDKKGTHVAKGSTDSPYQLGSFKPLLDLSEFGFSSDIPTSTPESNNALISLARNNSTRIKAPPSAYSKRVVDDPARTTDPADSAFATGGLLGRSYSTRQKAAREREATANTPVTGGLLGDFTAHGNLTVFDTPAPAQRLPERAFDNKSNITRTASTRRPGTARRSMDLATGQESAPSVAPTSNWSVWPSTNGHGTTNQPMSRNKSVNRRGPDSGHDDDRGLMLGARKPSEEKQPSPFAAAGLLAQSKGGWVEAGGHGVMDGSKANGPMLDVSESSIYTEGSLLRQAEMVKAERGPVIDRSRGREVTVGTGEGV